jgi:hypothetical protein
MPDPLVTTESYPGEYARSPVYDRVPSVEAIERLQTQPRLTQARAMRDEFTAAYRESLRS